MHFECGACFLILKITLVRPCRPPFRTSICWRFLQFESPQSLVQSNSSQGAQDRDCPGSRTEKSPRSTHDSFGFYMRSDGPHASLCCLKKSSHGTGLARSDSICFLSDVLRAHAGPASDMGAACPERMTVHGAVWHGRTGGRIKQPRQPRCSKPRTA